MSFQPRKFLFQKRRLFFPTGIFSLVLLPLLGFNLLFTDPHFHRAHVIPISYLSPRMMESVSIDLLSKNMPVISIQGNSEERKQKIDSILYLINYLQQDGTDSSLLQINLKDESTWGDFIAVINIFKKEKTPVYIVNGNKVWVYPDSTYRSTIIHSALETDKKIKSKRMFCGGCAFTPSPIIEEAPIEDPFQFLLNSPRFLMFIVGFCVLTFANILVIRRSVLRER